MVLALAAALLPVGVLAQSVTASAASTCPAAGQDSDCGVIITITKTGAQIQQTGQGPYDGSDDTLVGVVNNGNRPVSSLILSSGANIFGFDGDGIDTYGVAGNAKDSTGYGGPDTYYTAISTDQTSGTVNFVTPIPVGGSTYFGLENALTNAISCQDAINNSVKPTASGANIDATFTPNKGLSLAQAAALCGFKTFDWVQKDTKHDDPMPLFARNLNGAFNPNVKGPVHLTSKMTPWSDPPQGGGYYSPRRPNEAPDFSYPFYYDPNVDLPPNQAGGMIMTFHDAPNDPCRFGGGLANTPACNNSSQPPGSFASYVTHLAGVNFDGSATDLGIGFTWNTNYNGSTGGVYGVEGTAGTADGNGTGGVTITSTQETTTYQYDGLTVTGVNGGAVGPDGSMLVYSGAQALAQDGWDTLSAQLSKIDATPISGRAVTLTLGSGSRAQRCIARSDSSGNASCQVSVNQPLGPATVTASFAGDSSYAASSTSYTAIVFAYTKGGGYVIGNKSAGDLLAGPDVTFWSPQWAQQNQLSGGPAPAAFHGFENSQAPVLACQNLRSWVAVTPGARGTVLPTPVPAYTAVIVTSSVSDHGSSVSGNEVGVVIVATQAGTPGTGTIVADLC